MEAYLKKLCFEYQVEEKEVKELLARMERVYLDKGETIASATMPEQSLYIIVSGILHTFTTRQGEEKPSDSCPKVMLYCAIIQVNILSKH